MICSLVFNENNLHSIKCFDLFSWQNKRFNETVVTFNNDSGACAVFVNLLKAFDTVDHIILLKYWFAMALEEYLAIGFHLFFKVGRSVFP